MHDEALPSKKGQGTAEELVAAKGIVPLLIPF
jgi:hypothetical protein